MSDNKLPECRWPDCLTATEHAKLLRDINAAERGEVTKPSPDKSQQCRCVESVRPPARTVVMRDPSRLDTLPLYYSATDDRPTEQLLIDAGLYAARMGHENAQFVRMTTAANPTKEPDEPPDPPVSRKERWTEFLSRLFGIEGGDRNVNSGWRVD